MRSRTRSEQLDLARDLPTTAEDTEALRRARTARPLSLEEYVLFLEQLPPSTPSEQRAKSGPRADQPFAIH